MPIKSVTTRPPRLDKSGNVEEADRTFYEFVDSSVFNWLAASGALVQHTKYAGNGYGVKHDVLDGSLDPRFGVMAVTEDGVKQYRDAGYEVIDIRIVPSHFPVLAEQKRAEADLRRMPSTCYSERFVIENVYNEPEAALGDLERILKNFY